MKRLGIIGQGYVSLPIALAFSVYYPVTGFDTNIIRVHELKPGVYNARKVDRNKLAKAIVLEEETEFERDNIVSDNVEMLANYSVYIVTVPTPIDPFNVPDSTFLLEASKMLGQIIKQVDTIINESNVYLYCTQENCDLEDKMNTLTKIMKLTSESTPEAAEEIDQFYKKNIAAGIFKTESIKVTEASKAIENAQRDVNFSFVNVLALIFDRLGINTNDVLEAAGTKFNFLKYKNELVRGNCISVDPFYLAYKGCKIRLSS